jgi:hypothetical protein
MFLMRTDLHPPKASPGVSVRPARLAITAWSWFQCARRSIGNMEGDEPTRIVPAISKPCLP